MASVECLLLDVRPVYFAQIQAVAFLGSGGELGPKLLKDQAFRHSLPKCAELFLHWYSDSVAALTGGAGTDAFRDGHRLRSINQNIRIPCGGL